MPKTWRKLWRQLDHRVVLVSNAVVPMLCLPGRAKAGNVMPDVQLNLDGTGHSAGFAHVASAGHGTRRDNKSASCC